MEELVYFTGFRFQCSGVRKAEAAANPVHEQQSYYTSEVSKNGTKVKTSKMRIFII
jgi:hypothetical protein